MSQSQVSVRKVPTKNTSTTHIEIIWKVLNINQQLISTKSEEIQIKPEEGQGLQLKMQFLGHKNDLIELYYCYPSTAIIDISFVIINYYNNRHYQQGNPIEKSRCTNVRYNAQPCLWHYITTILKEDWSIINSSHGTNTIELKFDFKFYYTAANEPGIMTESQYISDMKKIMKEEKFSDIIIKSADDKEFKLHKIILSERCQVFKALFEHNSVEKQTNLIESPFQSDILSEVINFIYLDEVNFETNPQELLAAADYYQIDRLKNLCENVLIKDLTIKNVLAYVRLADLHSAYQLKEKAYEFIKNKGLTDVIKTKDWAQFHDVQLLRDILETMATIK